MKIASHHINRKIKKKKNECLIELSRNTLMSVVILSYFHQKATTFMCGVIISNDENLFVYQIIYQHDLLIRVGAKCVVI